MQEIFDSSYHFIYMSAETVGSTHDSLSFSVSKLAKNLAEGRLKPGYCISGDTAYECLNVIVKTWPRSKIGDTTLVDARDAFNYLQSSIRTHVEKSFEMLVARFGLLWRPILFTFDHGPRIVSS